MRREYAELERKEHEMKKVIQAIFSALLIAVLVYIVYLRVITEPLVTFTAPEVYTGGLIVQDTVKPAQTSSESATSEDTKYIMFFDERDAAAVAKMLWGEARGCSTEDQRNCVRTVCNRVDDPRWGSSPYEVVSQPWQYHGYDPSYPVDPDLYEIALSVLTEWSLSKQGVSCEWYSFNCFTGDGISNHFYTI